MYLYFFLIIPVFSLYISKPTVVVAEYDFLSHDPTARMSVTINNHIYRESTIVPSQKGYFPIAITHPGKYIFDYKITGEYSTHFDVHIKDGVLIYSKDNLIDKMITNTWTTLDTIYYYMDTTHTLDLYYQINFI